MFDFRSNRCDSTIVSSNLTSSAWACRLMMVNRRSPKSQSWVRFPASPPTNLFWIIERGKNQPWQVDDVLPLPNHFTERKYIHHGIFLILSFIIPQPQLTNSKYVIVILYVIYRVPVATLSKILRWSFVSN